MGSTDNQGVSFGGRRSAGFENFNGIARNDFNVQGNAKKKKLVDALFNAYNKGGAQGDDILDMTELNSLKSDIEAYANGGKAGKLGKREAQKFFTEKLGLANGEFTREELLEILNEISADQDSVESAQLIENNLTEVIYKEDPTSHTRKKELYNLDHKLFFDEIQGETEIVATWYKPGTTTKVAQESRSKDAPNVVTATEFAADGVTVKNLYRTSPGVREDFEPGGDHRILKRTTDVQGGKKVDDFEYRDGSYVQLTTMPNGDQTYNEIFNADAQGNVRRIEDQFVQGQRTQSTVYNGNDVAEQTIYSTEEGSSNVVARRAQTIDGNVVYTQEIVDQFGNTVSYVNTDAEGNPVNYKHTVDKANDTWYGIVQAKYGVTDPRTTMAIVHQLKASHHVARNAKTIPDEIELPAKVTVGDEEYSLQNIKKPTANVHLVPNAVAKPANIPAAELPQKIAPLTAAQRKVTIPPMPEKPAALTNVPEGTGTFPADKPKSIRVPNFPVVREKAGQLVQQPNGQFFQYDAAGRVVKVYANEYAAKNDKTGMEIVYSGADIKEINNFDWNTQGHLMGTVSYNKYGIAMQYGIGTKLDDNTYQINQYLMDGQLFIIQKNEYNAQNLCTRSVNYDNSGSPYSVLNYTYDDSGMASVNYINYEDESSNGEILVKNYANRRDFTLDNPSKIIYGTDGKPKLYKNNSYDEQGRWSGRIRYDKDGNAECILNNLGFDEFGMENYQVVYDLDGNVKNILKTERNWNGDISRCDTYTPQGVYANHYEYKYDADGQRKIIKYDVQGQIVSQ